MTFVYGIKYIISFGKAQRKLLAYPFYIIYAQPDIIIKIVIIFIWHQLQL